MITTIAAVYFAIFGLAVHSNSESKTPGPDVVRKRVELKK